MMLTTLPSISASPWSQYYPRTYVAPYLPSSIASTSLGEKFPIDGNLTKDIWSLAPWSDTFDDICGAAEPSEGGRPPSTCTTRVKMMWDDDYLYIGAHITADPDHPVIATYKERNSPIFQQDSDFEVFIDPTGGTHHHYKEYEVNALNTVWNLLLNKPYADGGYEHSGRVAKPGEPDYYDVLRQKSATSVIQGRINENEPCVWTVEIAMAYSDLLVGVTGGGKPTSIPKLHDRWRINFSRVERKGAINWTWQPQVVWDAASQKYRGVVDMHRPDAWGYLYFGDAAVTESSQDQLQQQQQQQQQQDGSREASSFIQTTTTTPPQDSTWLLRLAAMNIYYAQHEYNRIHGEFSPKLQFLEDYMDKQLVDQFSPVDVRINPETGGFVAILGGGGPEDSPSNHCSATIRDDRFLEVNCTSTVTPE